MKSNAIVYCEHAFNTPIGKTAHGLVRFTDRYHILGVIDSHYAGKDAGNILDGKPNGIPVFASLADALAHCAGNGDQLHKMVIGIAPDGGKLDKQAKNTVVSALRHGLSIDCGLHDFLNDDPDLVRLAEQNKVTLNDIRKAPPRDQLHFFRGLIDQVDACKIAILGTDSAVGKRTTAVLLTQALQRSGHTAAFIGTGQTAWLQGAKYCLLLDALPNDFVSGEIEHQIWTAWQNEQPEFIVIEGQGSLLNPAYPGGLEILAAARPDAVIMQHAPARNVYDGFDAFPLHPLERQLKAIEILSDARIAAITLNHENMNATDVDQKIAEISRQTGLPVFDVLLHGAEPLARHLADLKTRQKS